MSLFYVISVDCGSESVRTCIVQYSIEKSKDSVKDETIGRILITRKKDITILHPKPEYAEQSADEIWEAVQFTIKQCIDDHKLDTSLIKGIAFTATCSLALIGNKLNTGNSVIVWMDHRYELKVYEKTELFLELPCYLTFNCVKDDLNDIHSFKQSTAVCKHGYNAKIDQWPYEFYKKWGLDDLNVKICQQTLNPGRIAGYMTQRVREQLNIKSQDVAVSSSIIDAHAGVLFLITSFVNQKNLEGVEIDFNNVLCMISGTSTCAMVLTKEKKFTPKVWGPYYNVVLEDYYVREAGQSVTGKLIDFVVESHPDRKSKFAQLNTRQVIAQLNEIIIRRRMNLIQNQDKLSKDDLKKSIGNPLVLNPEFYEAIVESLAYELKYIVEELKMDHSKLKVLVSGGLTRNELYMQLHADILDCEIVSMKTEEADGMLIGTSILAHQAHKNSNLRLDNLRNISFEGISYTSYKPETLF